MKRSGRLKRYGFPLASLSPSFFSLFCVNIGEKQARFKRLRRV